MRIIGVIDSRDGYAVRAVALARADYPRLTNASGANYTPASYARRLRARCGLDEFYLADLTAIDSGQVDWSVIREVTEEASRLWIDIGLADGARVRDLAELASDVRSEIVPIIGLESLPTSDELVAWAQVLEGAALSLDLRGGVAITSIAAWRNDSPIDIVVRAADCGLRRMILLDLASVGSSNGCPTLELCQRVRAKCPGLEIVTGGGVRDADDLRRLEEAGADAALVGTWLYRQCGVI